MWRIMFTLVWLSPLPVTLVLFLLSLFLCIKTRYLPEIMLRFSQVAYVSGWKVDGAGGNLFTMETILATKMSDTKFFHIIVGLYHRVARLNF